MFADKFFPPIFRSDFTPSKLSRYGRRTSGSGVQNEAWGRFDFGTQNEPENQLGKPLSRAALNWMIIACSSEGTPHQWTVRFNQAFAQAKLIVNGATNRQKSVVRRSY